MKILSSTFFVFSILLLTSCGGMRLNKNSLKYRSVQPKVKQELDNQIQETIIDDQVLGEDVVSNGQSNSIEHLDKQSECDTLFYRDGKVILAIVEKVGASKVKYSLCHKNEMMAYRVKKKKLSRISYAFGEQQLFEEEYKASKSKESKLVLLGFFVVVVGAILTFIFPPAAVALIVGGLLITHFAYFGELTRARGRLAIATFILGYSALVFSVLMLIVYIAFI